MASTLAIYTVVHQPRRLKLPAQPIPRGASVEDITRCLFDEQMNERYFRKVAQSSYYPAARMFLELVRQSGVHLSLGISLSFVHQAVLWDPALLDLFRELIAEEHVELIGVEPYHSFLFLFDLPMFVLRMQSMSDELEQVFGKRPGVADTTEMCMSAPIYNALDTAGFRGALLDGRQQVFEWREAAYLYQYSDESPLPLPLALKKAQYAPRSKRSSTKLLVDNDRENGPYLLARHTNLSDDVGFRFSNRNWNRYPLFADTYATWIAQTPGDIVLLGWDFETFGEHHRPESGIFDFMRSLPSALERRGISFCTPGAFIDRTVASQSNVYHLPLPISPTTWAGDGSMDFFLGNSAQQTIFHLMNDVYNTAKLTENPDLINLALWMAQSDNLHLIQWYGRAGSQADVSSYFTPREWWDLGADTIIREQQRVYLNLMHSMEPYLPTRLMRQQKRTSANKSSNSRNRKGPRP
jgi:alpha-amylase